MTGQDALFLIERVRLRAVVLMIAFIFINLAVMAANLYSVGIVLNVSETIARGLINTSTLRINTILFASILPVIGVFLNIFWIFEDKRIRIEIESKTKALREVEKFSNQNSFAEADWRYINSYGYRPRFSQAMVTQYIALLFSFSHMAFFYIVVTLLVAGPASY